MPILLLWIASASSWLPLVSVALLQAMHAASAYCTCLKVNNMQILAHVSPCEHARKVITTR